MPTAPNPGAKMQYRHCKAAIFGYPKRRPVLVFLSEQKKTDEKV